MPQKEKRERKILYHTSVYHLIAERIGFYLVYNSNEKVFGIAEKFAIRMFLTVTL